jgi:molecular chaperone HscB
LNCWSCKEPLRPPAHGVAAVCVGCGAVQPPPARPDPFAVLGMAPRWHIEEAAVDATYRSMARQVHPDRFAARPAVERRMALQWTAALNEARRVLKDPMRRAWQLVIGQPEPRDAGGPRLDPDFLALVFEWREADEERPGAFAELAASKKAELEVEIAARFTEIEEGRGSTEGLEARLAELKYVAAPGTAFAAR